MCPRINDTAFTPPRGFRYGTYSQQTNHHHPHLYKPGTTPCGLPRFPCPSAPPPGPYGPVSRGPSGRGGPSGGRAPGPDGDPAPRAGARRHGAPPDSAACERTAPPIIESGSPRSGDRDAAQRIRMDMGREGRREGKERMDVRMDE